MSNYLNTARKSRLFIDGQDLSDRMISWEVSDQSAFKNGFIITSGQVILGTNNLSQFDYQKNRFKRGKQVILDLFDQAEGWQRHPRGLLYVIGESFDPSSQQVTLEIGCRLALMALSDSVDEVMGLSPFTLDNARSTFDNVRQAFAAAGQYLYQDNQGVLQSGSVFGDGGFGDPASVETTWTSDSRSTVLRVEPLAGAAPIPDEIKLSYQFATTTPSDAPGSETTTETSEYDIKYPGVIFTRVGSGRIPTDTSGDSGTAGSGSVCGNSPQAPSGSAPGSGNAASCSGIFKTVEEPTKKRGRRREITTTTYGGPGQQVSNITKDTYGPALELNPQYFADRYAYCRFNYATACNPNGSCATEGLNEVLQMRTIESYRYDSAGTLVERNLEEYRPTLAAAQPFDWRSGVISGVPTSFNDLSTSSLFRSRITNARYATQGSTNVETITLSESSAVKSRSGIGATPQETVSGGNLLLSAPTSYPSLSGTISGLPVTTASGAGSGMTVTATFADGNGTVTSAAIKGTSLPKKRDSLTEPLPASYPQNDAFAGGTGTGFRGTIGRQLGPFLLYPSEGQEIFWGPLTINDGGSGYTAGNVLTWSGNYDGEVKNVKVRVLSVSDERPVLSIDSLGSGYKVGDTLRISKAAIAEKLGRPVSSDINFSVVGAADSAVQGGRSIVTLDINRRPQSFNKGHYVNVPVQVMSGSGGGASVNIEAIRTGEVTRVNAYQQPEIQEEEGTPEYVASLGEIEIDGGSGKGLKLELGIGEYRGRGDLVPYVITVRRIIDGGTGYRSGEALKVTAAQLEQAFNIKILPEGADQLGDYQFRTWSSIREHQEWRARQNGPQPDLKLAIAASVGEVFIFPSSVGANFSRGDRLQVSSAVLQSIGAQQPGVNTPIDLTVNKISSEREIGSLRLDAAEGLKSVTVNTSSTKSTLPSSPDSVANPTIQTETVETVIPLREESYEVDVPGAGPITLQESVPIPLILDNREEVLEAVSRYGAALKSFTMGEALGLAIGETMRSEIMTNWQPMAGFRYLDSFSGATMAMRADACTWGVNQQEAAVTISGLWIGNEVELIDSSFLLSADVASTTSILDQGDYVEQIDTFLNLGSGISGATDSSGLTTPVTASPVFGNALTPVIAVEGMIVANGGTVTLDGSGGIPAEYQGQVLLDDAVVADEDLFSAE